jgi:hypothetical protein
MNPSKLGLEAGDQNGGSVGSGADAVPVGSDLAVSAVSGFVPV